MEREFSYQQLEDKACELYLKEHGYKPGLGYFVIDDPVIWFKKALEALRQEDKDANESNL